MFLFPIFNFPNYLQENWYLILSNHFHVLSKMHNCSFFTFLSSLSNRTNTRNVFHPINFLLDAYVQFLVNIWFLGKTVFKTMFLRFLRTNIMINFNILSIKPFFHNLAQRRRTGSVESVECKED
jgi:hypothetical protein